jgi:xanthine dehydrogenase accessory factor
MTGRGKTSSRGFEAVPQGMDARMARRIGELAAGAEPCAVCTVVNAVGAVPGKLGATMVVHASGATEGTVGGAGLEERVRSAALRALEGAGGDLLTFDLARWKEGGLDSLCGGTVSVSVQVIVPAPHLLLFGGGHCGQALGALCGTLGWSHTVVESRAEFATGDLFPGADARFGGIDAALWAREADLSPFTHAFLLGHSHEVDTAILLALLPRFAGPVGMVGSKAKRHAAMEAGLAAGLPRPLMDRVRCPIGLEIGARTPAEIALAVAAEILAERRKPQPKAALPSARRAGRSGGRSK